MGRHYNTTHESRLKMSLQRKGRVPWNKGLTSATDERVKNISEKTSSSLRESYRSGKVKTWNDGITIDKSKYPNMGHHSKHSEESRKKMSQSQLKNPQRYWLGKKLSEETKKKLSASHKANGIIPPSRKGTTSSEETRLKQSKSLKGKPSAMKGKTHTDEAKKKISLAAKGEKHFNWKGGITPLVMRIRHCPKYKQWRIDIFKRDDFTCQLCDKRGGYLEADHYPKLFSAIFKENNIKSIEEALDCVPFWDISNGRTLCKECHNKTKYGRKAA